MEMDDIILSFEDERLFTHIDEDFDFCLALSLQEQNVHEDSKSCEELVKVPGKALSVVAPEWETLDPNPDIHKLFIQYNYEFFWGCLESVEVKWSKRMTVCAGICVYEGRGGFCSVRLSQPLLKFRPRKDLVETLLHEMIHAYLFVTQNNKDHDGHGPEFLKHMSRINQQTGAKISVYHNFHDEVEFHRKHWWKCNGPCQYRKPYFGILKRATNRAPSPRDLWWADHKAKCGGQYVKIKEPENYGKTKQKDKSHNSSQSGIENKDIRNFFPGDLDKSFSSDDVARLGSAISTANAGSRIVGVDALQDAKKLNGFVPFSGKGYVLGNSSITNSDNRKHGISKSAMGTKLSRFHGRDMKSFGNAGNGERKPTFLSNVGHCLGSGSDSPTNEKLPKVNGPQKQKKLDCYFQSPSQNHDSKKVTSKRESNFIFNSSNIEDVEVIKSAKKFHIDSATNDISENKISCPVCGIFVSHQEINAHLDNCLNS